VETYTKYHQNCHGEVSETITLPLPVPASAVLSYDQPTWSRRGLVSPFEHSLKKTMSAIYLQEE